MSKSKRKNLHFRELESHRFAECELPAEFAEFAERHVWPRLESLHKYKKEQKREMAAQCTYAIIIAYLSGNVIADTRNTGRKGTSLRVSVWKALVDAGFANVCVGSESSGMVTRYQATSKLLHLRKLWKRKLLDDDRLYYQSEGYEATKRGLVLLTPKERYWWLPGEFEELEAIPLRAWAEAFSDLDPDDITKPDANQVEAWLAAFWLLEDAVNSINTENLKHSWTAFRESPDTGAKVAFQPGVCLRQIHSGTMFRAARLYTSGRLEGQGLSKEQRKEMLIDGEQAAGIDSVSHNIRLLYHAAQLDPQGDVYYPALIFPAFYSFRNVSKSKQAVARDLVKRATNMCLNNSSRTAAVQALAGWMHKRPDGDFLHNLVFDVEGTDLNGVVDRICDAHPEAVLSQFFCDAGAELMTLDGNIMLHTLLELVADRHKPALAIHDGLVVRVRDVREAEQVYCEQYRKFTGFMPLMRREF